VESKHRFGWLELQRVHAAGDDELARMRGLATLGVLLVRAWKSIPC
jgi:hypothetical protein